MKVLMLRNPSDSLGCSLRENESGQVSQSLGRQLVQLGVAVEIEEQQKPQRQARTRAVRGVQDRPSIANAEVKLMQRGKASDE